MAAKLLELGLRCTRPRDSCDTTLGLDLRNLNCRAESIIVKEIKQHIPISEVLNSEVFKKTILLSDSRSRYMKTTRRLIIAAFTLLLCIPSVRAQDIHFSQFYAAPLDLNPAMTGVFNCTQRFTANYRNQLSSVLRSNAYNTYAVSYDQKIAVGRTDYFGIGGIITADVAGSLDFGTISGRISGAYSKQLYSSREVSHNLSAGFNAGVTQRSLNWTAAQWGLQHDGSGGFDPAGPAENVDNSGRLDQDFLFADFSAGLLYFGVFNQGKSSAYFGVAASHLNRANQAVYVTDQDGNEVFNPLYTKYTIHAGGELGLNNGISFVPGIVYFNQGPQTEINLGTAVRFTLSDSRFQQQFLQFGIWTRIADQVLLDDDGTGGPLVSGEDTNPWLDAFILYTKFDFNEFGIGFSYDINVSDLNVASNSNGAFEFSLIYKICGSETRGVYCPKF